MSTGGTVRDLDPVFAELHRAQDRRRAAIALGWAVAAALVIAGVAAVGAAHSAHAAAKVAIPFDKVDAVSHTASTSSPVPTVAPTVAAGPIAPVVTPSVLAPTGPTSRTITVTATGYQTELDACQWVRMDLLATVPLVGAHTRCGGAVVLTLRDGDSIRLVGQGLDGAYLVIDSRDAHSGDDAATATDGMNAAVILQTCYPGVGGRVRLVGLVPA